MTRCRFEKLKEKNPWTLLRCKTCGLVVQLKLARRDAWQHLDKLPPCGLLAAKPTALSARHKSNGLSTSSRLAGAQAGAEKLGVTWSDARRYAAALARWARAGFPMRTDQSVDRIVALCQQCDGFVAGRCKHCGCRINHGPALTNKARMATEKCPKSHWPED